MRKRQSKFKRILKATRKWGEEISAYRPDYYDSGLGGLCAIVSKELFARLRAEGLDCEIAYNTKHCFVLYKNRVIDLTATQFNKPRIHIFSIKGRDKGNWTIKKTFTNIKELSDYQEERGWYQSQIELPSEL